MMEQEMEEEKKKSSSSKERRDEKWVYDSSVDHKGTLPLRASTGVWKASLFIIAIEFSERLSYFGIATNLITYLIRVMHQDLKTAAKNVNYWSGVTTIMPLIGGFLADGYTGRFFMVLFSSLIYLMGLCLLTMTQYIPSLKPCDSNRLCDDQNQPRKIHEVVFFLAIYCVSLGTGGHKPCLESFGADQFDDDHAEERKQKMSYFNWWNNALCCGLFLGVTVIVYIQDHIGWGVANLILSIVMAIAIVVFYLGKPFYRYRVPGGSPLTPLFQVIVAALRKRNQVLPRNPDLLYEVPNSQKSSGRLLSHTNKLRFLDKAAVITEDEKNLSEKESKKQQNPSWRLSTVTKVEETKLLLNMIPIWLTSLPFGICVAQASTFFVKQSGTMNRHIGSSFELPPASIYSLSAVGMIISVLFYERILVPFLRKAKGNERGIEILQRIGIGMIFSSLSMFAAALVERKRLSAHENENIISVFWLVPQFMILGIGDGFTLVGLQEYFYDQVPDSMRSLGIAFYLSVLGCGSFLSSFLISVVDNVTKKNGRGSSWFGKDLNKSRLDKFYWLLAVLNGLNLCVYVFLAKRYSYKNVHRDDDDHNSVVIVEEGNCHVGDHKHKNDGVEMLA